MHFVIFSGGSFQKSKLVEDVLTKADRVIAADNGSSHAIKIGVVPYAIVGDFDSISVSLKKQLQKKHVEFQSFPQEKDETDTELAIQYAIQKGATKITLLGGNSGDRFDHILANFFLAAILPIPLYFINDNQISWIEKGPAFLDITGKKGDLLSLIPISGNVEHITTKNLEYPLNNESLIFGKPRGISNELTGKKAYISFQKGYLLVTHTMLSL